MEAFPDMQVLMDGIRIGDDAIEYHWTLVGTNAGARATACASPATRSGRSARTASSPSRRATTTRPSTSVRSPGRLSRSQARSVSSSGSRGRAAVIGPEPLAALLRRDDAALRLVEGDRPHERRLGAGVGRRGAQHLGHVDERQRRGVEIVVRLLQLRRLASERDGLVERSVRRQHARAVALPRRRVGVELGRLVEHLGRLLVPALLVQDAREPHPVEGDVVRGAHARRRGRSPRGARARRRGGRRPSARARRRPCPPRQGRRRCRGRGRSPSTAPAARGRARSRRAGRRRTGRRAARPPRRRAGCAPAPTRSAPRRSAFTSRSGVRPEDHAAADLVPGVDLLPQIAGRRARARARGGGPGAGPRGSGRGGAPFPCSCHASARSASSSNVAIARSASGAQLVAARGAEHVREMAEPDLGAELGELVAELRGPGGSPRRSTSSASARRPAVLAAPAQDRGAAPTRSAGASASSASRAAEQRQADAGSAAVERSVAGVTQERAGAQARAPRPGGRPRRRARRPAPGGSRRPRRARRGGRCCARASRRGARAAASAAPSAWTRRRRRG